MRIEKLKAIHVEEMRARGAITFASEWLTFERLKFLENEKYAFTLFNGDQVLATGGVMEYWPNRAEAWVFIDPHSRPHFLGLHNAVKRCLDVVPYRRIEATVDVGFPAGHRWIKLLGFQLEAERMRSFTIDGRDMALYSRIREGE